MACAAGVAVVRAPLVEEAVEAAPSLVASEALSYSDPAKASLQFQLYKIALSVREGEAHKVRDLVNATFAHVDPNFDLGCDGVKINGYLMSYGPQVHWVEASILSNDPQPIKMWQDYFEEINGDLSSFNAFMHNKVAMFHTNVSAPYAVLKQQKVPLMERKSSGYGGKASPTGELAHVMFQVAGRIYEIAGPVTEAVRAQMGTDAWEEWGEDECMEAHMLDDNLDEYAKTYDDYVAGANTIMQKWAEERGYFPPMLSYVSVATERSDDESLDDGALTTDLLDVAKIHSYKELDTSTCSITRVETVSSKGFRSPVRYVDNAVANAMLATVDPVSGEKTGLTVEDYNAYIFKTHSEVAGAYDNWAGWDHWMDQHIGLKYVGSEACAVSHQLNQNLTSRGIAVGQRTTADYGAEKAIHWYTGYAGSMTWEYWVTGCSEYSTDYEADVCACHASNNDKIFLKETGTNCTSFGEDQWLIHD